jgi:glycosyltransferase involved in cell wall biosynthesis
MLQYTNNFISVVTVTYNNLNGLIRTLESLSILNYQPKEILVIDGGSTDGSLNVLDMYLDKISALRYISARDDGIYDAMNKGRSLAKCNLIHYLNAGDTVYGEPYMEIEKPAILPVEVFSEKDKQHWHDFIKMQGYGYCHQGIIFPSTHAKFSIEYQICADFDVIVRTFPYGLKSIRKQIRGGVRYYLGGISSEQANLLDKELVKIAWRRMRRFRGICVIAELKLRRLIPRPLRRLLGYYLSKN